MRPEYSLALLAIIPLAMVELAKAARWRALFGLRRPPYAACLRAVVAGQLTNALSPLRAGEAVRLGVLAAQGGAMVPAAGAMAGAKAIDTLCLAAIAVAVVGRSVLEHPGWGMIGGLAVAALGVVLIACGRTLRGMLDTYWLSRKLRLSALIDVAQALRDPRVLAVVVSATAVVWAAGLAANGVVLAAVGIPPTLDLMARVLVAGYIVGLVPAPPARLGVFETGVTVALSSAGVPLAEAITAAVALHVCQLAELGILMAAGLLVRRWSWATRSAA
ncbi:MAG TPA: lysylphosphatidylglycerol synthase domain-containing protein [Chloroflexota bacterium]|nr:lysylphosphatidylglycerol synthase domain-containing protein [Chloroflexota bacterium]